MRKTTPVPLSRRSLGGDGATTTRQRQTARHVPASHRRARLNDARTPRFALVWPHTLIADRHLEQPRVRPWEVAGGTQIAELSPQILEGWRALPRFPTGPRHRGHTQQCRNLALPHTEHVQTDKIQSGNTCHKAQLTDTVSLSRWRTSIDDVHFVVMASDSDVMTDPLLKKLGAQERIEPNLESLGMRLKRLRTARKWLQADVAERLSVAEVSVTRWETDAQTPRPHDIKRLAELYTVPQAWLHYGGSGGPQTIAVVGIVGAGQTIAATDDGPIDEVAVPYGTSPDMLAVEVRGDSMEPVYSDGNILLYRGHPQNPDELIGQRVIVRTESGLVMVKRLRRGADLDTFDLDSTNAATIPSQRLVWVAKVEAVIHR